MNYIGQKFLNEITNLLFSFFLLLFLKQCLLMIIIGNLVSAARFTFWCTRLTSFLCNLLNNPRRPMTLILLCHYLFSNLFWLFMHYLSPCPWSINYSVPATYFVECFLYFNTCHWSNWYRTLNINLQDVN